MKTSNISKISASIPNTKKAKFNLSHDNNTTYDWGSVQPLMSKLMLPDSSINVNMEQLTRLAPMVVPTFGRVKMKNIAHFIPIQEIFPNWDAMMSKTKVTHSGANSSAVTYVPNNVPYINNNILTSFILAGAKVNLYYSGNVGSSDENRWICQKNTGTFAAPNNSAITTCARQYLYRLLDIANSATSPTYTLSPWNYTGYTINTARLLLNKNGSRLIPAGGQGVSMFKLPSISTCTCQSLPNANHNGYTHSANNEDNGMLIGGGNANLGPITFDGADLIWEYDGSDPTVGIASADRAVGSGTPVADITASDFDGKKIRLVFKLSSFGKRLRKILIGLGYDINLANDDNVSILPLIAFYKAWWDTYAPERVKNFYETNAWKIINASMSSSTACDLLTTINSSNGSTFRDYFDGFIADLGTCFATERVDAISAATDAYYTDSSNFNYNYNAQTEFQNAVEHLLDYAGLLDGNGPLANEDGSFGMWQNYTDGLSHPTSKGQEALLLNTSGNTVKITQTALNALKKAYITINKQSIAGKKVEEILRSLGLGDYIEECKGKFINADDNAIKISDVVATAATSDAKLGQYGGRGIGVGNFQFSFQTNRHGYMIILSSIVPESGYINAPVHENEAISFETMYNPEFDGIAYEAIQKKNLAGSPLVNDASYADTFGFLPTYSQWKFMTNKANGDFSLNSMKTSLTPYTLDKYIPVADTNVYDSHEISTGTNTGSTEIDCAPSFKYSDLPNAGEDYRFINKFPWNGNYNRIFAADDDGFEWSVFSKNNNQFLYNSFEYDNFLVHNVFDIAYWAHMKSIEDSYGTYDEEHGAPNTSVTRS